MGLLRKWNEYLGPKDERLTAESNACYKTGYYVFLWGTLACLYYGIMVNQVSSTTETPLYTEAGDATFPLYLLLALVVLAGAVVPQGMQQRRGIMSDHNRYAEVEHIPWDFVALLSVATGALAGVLTAGMRIIAEIQIVGIGQVTWAGDIAMGVVIFGMAFALCMVFASLSFRDAIKRRQQLESELEEE